MDAKERALLIERYGSGLAAVKEALSGITDAELDARPGQNEWTAREVVHHLADAEMRAAIRLRQLIAEDSPVIQGYDEKSYTVRCITTGPSEHRSTPWPRRGTRAPSYWRG